MSAERGSCVVEHPHVAVLMATHDGALFLREQIDSVLGQRDVVVRLVISDDASTDGTSAVLAEYADDPRVVLLPPGAFGSAQGNFYRLVRDADVDGVDAIGFSDQDDVWLDDKLARQLPRLADAAATSSNVTAVFDGSRRVLLEKSQPQRELDFVCESAGPGCTFLLRPDAYSAVRDVIAGDERVASTAIHDWLIYAIVRALELPWIIAPESLVEYRQHGRNVTGANVGLRQASVRLGQLRDGRFRRDSALIAEIAADSAVGHLRATLLSVARLLRDDSRSSRRGLMRLVPKLRRRARDRIALRLAIALGIW